MGNLLQLTSIGKRSYILSNTTLSVKKKKKKKKKFANL